VGEPFELFAFFGYVLYCLAGVTLSGLFESVVVVDF